MDERGLDSVAEITPKRLVFIFLNRGAGVPLRPQSETERLHPTGDPGRIERGAGRLSKKLHDGRSGADRRANADVMQIAASILLRVCRE